jgi:acetyltransferase-like isoleucine patch superfamily enzyme
MTNEHSSLRPDDRAHHLLVGERVEIAESAQIGAHVVLHDDVVIGPHVVVKHNSVIGASRARDAGSRSTPVDHGVTRIGDGAIICLNAVIFSGASVGAGCLVGDFAYVSPLAVLGDNSVVGGHTQVGMRARIGARVRIQNASVVTPDAVLVMFTTDSTLARAGKPADWPIRVRRAARIGAGVVITPGIDIGEESFIAAGAVVVRDVEPRTKLRGVPGRVFGSVTEDELLENWR